jgi:hypothetical protein
MERLARPDCLSVLGMYAWSELQVTGWPFVP